MKFLAGVGFGIWMNTGLAFFNLIAQDTFFSAAMSIVHFLIASILLYILISELTEIFPQLKKEIKN